MNRTVYLTTTQNADFKRGAVACRLLGVSVGSVCAEALGRYADTNKDAVAAIEAARSQPKGEK